MEEKLTLENVETKHAAGKAQSQMMGMILKIMGKDKVPEEVIPQESINNDTILSLAGQLSSIKDEEKVKCIIDTILLSCSMPELLELQEELNYNISKALYYAKPKQDEGC